MFKKTFLLATPLLLSLFLPLPAFATDYLALSMACKKSELQANRDTCMAKVLLSAKNELDQSRQEAISIGLQTTNNPTNYRMDFESAESGFDSMVKKHCTRAIVNRYESVNPEFSKMLQIGCQVSAVSRQIEFIKSMYINSF
jgi:hypothetical protein